MESCYCASLYLITNMPNKQTNLLCVHRQEILPSPSENVRCDNENQRGAESSGGPLPIERTKSKENESKTSQDPFRKPILAGLV